MPGYSAQEIVTTDAWEEWPDLDLVLIEAEPDFDAELVADAPEQEAA